MAKKENKFYALIIPAKDVDEFFKLYPKYGNRLQEIEKNYADFRKSKGKNTHNNYIICNQDEPYAEQVWQLILDGEKQKEQV